MGSCLGVGHLEREVILSEKIAAADEKSRGVLNDPATNCSVTERLGPSVCEQKGRRVYNVVAW
jgi:hypothetical protein